MVLRPYRDRLQSRSHPDNFGGGGMSLPGVSNMSQKRISPAAFGAIRHPNVGLPQPRTSTDSTSNPSSLLMVTIADAAPSLAQAYTLLAFTIVIIGGLGSMAGALVGGVLIGVSEALAGFFFEPSMKSMFSFALLVVVLMLRPQGLMGRRA